jgi:hypothetical protein
MEVRAFGWGRVVSGEMDGRHVLIFQERANSRHILYEYDDPEEFQADLGRVVRFPGPGDNGDHGAGLPAPIVPLSPTRIAGAEEPIPEEPGTVDPYP